MEINIYSQYFEAKANFSGIEREGAYVTLHPDGSVTID
jgi:hypothetical protein